MGDVSSVVVVPIRDGAAFQTAIGGTARENAAAARQRKRIWETALVRCREALQLTRPVKQFIDPATGLKVTSIEQLKRLDRVLVSCYGVRGGETTVKGGEEGEEGGEGQEQLSAVRSGAKKGAADLRDVLFLPMIDVKGAAPLPPITTQ
jgi:hypothetical protein